jgi:hypothetical protein
MKTTMVKRNSLGLAAAIAFFAGAVVTQPLTAVAAEKQVSDKVVKYIMEHTWDKDIMPAEITVEGEKKGEKKVIKVDRDKKETSVKEDEAREIIMVARRSALAETCGLKDLKEKNYKTLMAMKQMDKTKSILDIVYINQMHLLTVYLLRGQVVETGEKADPNAAKKLECTPEQKTEVQAQIEEFVKAHPIAEKTATATNK